MITVEEVKEITKTSYSDSLVQKMIDRSIDFLKAYTNNQKIYTEDDSGVLNDPLELDDVLLYLVISKINKLNRSGLDSEGMGEISKTYSKEELTPEMKIVLGKYVRAVWL